MIEGIDIFQPRENGLPDFTKISPAQIFNGSVAASIQGMKDSAPVSPEEGYQGVQESPWRNTTIDPSTGRRVEVRRARVVEDILNGSSPTDRGHRTAGASRQRSSGGGDYSVPSSGNPEPPLPSDGNILLDDPISDGVPSNDGPYSPLLPPPTPEEEKKTALGRLPVMLLEELKSLGYKV